MYSYLLFIGSQEHGQSVYLPEGGLPLLSSSGGLHSPLIFGGLYSSFSSSADSYSSSSVSEEYSSLSPSEGLLFPFVSDAGAVCSLCSMNPESLAVFPGAAAFSSHVNSVPFLLQLISS